MIQATRSGKQNIAEGSAASSTWREAELKLTNVAKACLQELLIDYEDYQRVRNLEQWSVNSSKAEQTRMACKNHTDSTYFRKAIAVRPDETIANIAITLNRQTDSLPRKLIDHLKTEFLTHGGIKEEMYAARKEWRRQNQ
jgi:four helix bundle suffix protein